MARGNRLSPLLPLPQRGRHAGGGDDGQVEKGGRTAHHAAGATTMDGQGAIHPVPNLCTPLPPLPLQPQLLPGELSVICLRRALQCGVGRLGRGAGSAPPAVCLPRLQAAWGLLDRDKEGEERLLIRNYELSVVAFPHLEEACACNHTAGVVGHRVGGSRQGQAGSVGPLAVIRTCSEPTSMPCFLCMPYRAAQLAVRLQLHALGGVTRPRWR